jgi:hypothetical protein
MRDYDPRRDGPFFVHPGPDPDRPPIAEELYWDFWGAENRMRPLRKQGYIASKRWDARRQRWVVRYWEKG